MKIKALQYILKLVLTEKQRSKLHNYLVENMPFWESRLILEENKAIILHDTVAGGIKKAGSIGRSKQSKDSK